MTIDFRTRPLVILGAGYTSKFLYAFSRQCGWETYGTSRQPDRHLAHIAPERRIEFDLLNPSTWTHIPTNAHLDGHARSLAQRLCAFVDADAPSRRRCLIACLGGHVARIRVLSPYTGSRAIPG